MHPSSERRTDQNPKHTGQIPELRGKHRPHQRSRTGDRRKMMSEDNPPIGRHEILSVKMGHRWSRTVSIQYQHLGDKPFAVKPVRDRE
jgi:hypothetical protein